MTTLSFKLTASAIKTYQECPRKFEWAYIDKIRPIADSDALRFGSAYHSVFEWHDAGLDWPTICARVMNRCVDRYETQQVLRLSAEHHRHYIDDGYRVIASEHVWETDGETGMIDRIVELPDRRRAVQEYKTSSDEISPGSLYWKRLRMDIQVSMYRAAAKADTIIYDVTRKPTIRPVQVPTLDEDGAKIVVDDNTGERVKNKNGTWKQSATSGCSLVSRDETPEEYGDRLTADIRSRPDFYFQRQEIARLDGDADAAREDIASVRELIATGIFPRTTAACTRWGTCRYFDLCAVNRKPGDGVPSGFVHVTHEHQELQNDDDATTTPA